MVHPCISGVCDASIHRLPVWNWIAVKSVKQLLELKGP